MSGLRAICLDKPMLPAASACWESISGSGTGALRVQSTKAKCKRNGTLKHGMLKLLLSYKAGFLDDHR